MAQCGVADENRRLMELSTPERRKLVHNRLVTEMIR